MMGTARYVSKILAHSHVETAEIRHPSPPSAAAALAG